MRRAAAAARARAEWSACDLGVAEDQTHARAAAQIKIFALPQNQDMAAEAVFGLVGVLLGSVSTSVVAVYQVQLAGRREREARDHERAEASRARRNAFQRESITALQDAAADMIKAVYDEQDRQLERMDSTSDWPARQWETPTAVGWSDAEIRLQVARARVFDSDLRALAHETRAVARELVWAPTLDKAKQSNLRLDELYERFNERVAQALQRLD
ncbi:hypothetical protein GCM10027610_071390 [Dactylosporangium cerinum]